MASVVVLPDWPLSGPLVTLKATGALAMALFVPSNNVAVSVIDWPTILLIVVGLSASVGGVLPVLPIACHGCDSLRCGLHEPRSIPPVSRIWALSASVVLTPPMVKVIVGCTVDSCPQYCGKLVCQPVCETKTVTTRHYTDRCTDVCQRCTALSLLFPSKCGCSHVRTRKDLVVKLRKCDKCVTVCVPVTEPVCSAPCDSGCHHAAPVHVQGQMPAITTMPAGPITMPLGK